MIATMTEPIESQSLSHELWVSLASLLRSHVAMHSIAQPGGDLRLVRCSDMTIEILGPFGKLSVLGPDRGGECALEFRPESGELGDEYSTFRFTEEGFVQFDQLDSALDVEAAVEYLLRKVQA